MRRVMGIALAWGMMWTLFWAIVGGITRIVDPESIDPGEGWMLVVVLAPMGLLTGVVLGTLLSVREAGRTPIDLSLPRVVGWGTLATALVQVLYLGHGDQGLAANAGMALLFCAFGGVVTAVWLLAARGWSRWRAARLT